MTARRGRTPTLPDGMGALLAANDGLLGRRSRIACLRCERRWHTYLASDIAYPTQAKRERRVDGRSTVWGR